MLRVVSDIAVFVLTRDVKLQPTNQPTNQPYATGPLSYLSCL